MEKNGLEQLGFQHISKTVPQTNKKIYDFQSGNLKPLKTFSEKMNEKMMFLPGDSLVVAGRSGVGKSAFANVLLESLFEYNNDVLGLYFSHEMAAWRQIMRLYSNKIEKSVSEMLKGKFDKEAFDRIKSIGENLAKHELYFRVAPLDSDKWLQIIKKVRELYPDKTIVTVFDHTRLIKGNQKSEEQKITDFMMKGREANLQYNTFNIFLSQMNRSIESGKDDGNIGNRSPASSDIFGADSVMQFADHVLALHRPEMYDIKEFKGQDTANLLSGHVLKQRDGWIGVIPFDHNLKHNQIWDRDTSKQKQFGFKK